MHHAISGIQCFRVGICFVALKEDWSESVFCHFNGQKMGCHFGIINEYSAKCQRKLQTSKYSS